MGFFRQRIRIGSYVALPAILIGLALSFAHVHVHASAAQATIAVDSGSGQTDDDDKGGRCDLCALLGQFGATVLASVPAFALLRLAGEFDCDRPAMRSAATIVRVGFQSRAPPRA